MGMDTNDQNQDDTPKVIGIGGVFFSSENPDQSKDWYVKNLGFEINEWGAVSFDSRNIHSPDTIDSLQWSSVDQKTDFFSPSRKGFMINYRVQHIEKLVEQLRKNGVTILDSIASYPYGKFVHILDGEGNKIELWEPC